LSRTQPNILVVMYDQLAPSALGCYGNPAVRSPHIDALASSGVVFDAAYANSPLCSPARSCMLTGQLPSATGGYDNASYWPSTIPSVAHYLRAGGYRTVLTGKMHFVGPDQLHGFEERRTTDIYPADFGWTPDWRHPEERIDWWMHNMSSVFEAGVFEVTNQLLYDDEVGHQAVRALHDIARQDDGRPFFAVASFTHPHDPYQARQRYWDLYDGIDIPMPAVSAADVRGADPHGDRLAHMCDWGTAEIPEEAVRRARRGYLANVSYVDEWTGRLMDTLRALELADDTVVVLVSDHGDMLGERGHWYKMSFFEGSARVPLVIHTPDRFKPVRVAEPVSLVDFLPTMLDLAGLSETESVDELAGESVLPLCDGTGASSPRTVIGEYLGEGAVAPIVMIRRGTWKFVHSPGDPDQLYDLQADPNELANLAADPAHAAAVAEFRAEVAQRWDLEALRQQVLTDQARRRLVTTALRSGRFTPWDYTPPRDDTGEYMRNHLDLYDVERRARWPR
jgi:choline-sulfatase